MQAESIGSSVKVPIRRIRVVVDMEDPLNPEVIYEDFVSRNRCEPSSPRYRVITLEIVTCPEDQQPILLSECGKCPTFLRRLDDHAYFRKH